jgi:hypothetical protein
MYNYRYKIIIQNTPSYIPPLAQIKQEIWRQKQIQILYGSGRPIFGKFKWTKHDAKLEK